MLMTYAISHDDAKYIEKKLIEDSDSRYKYMLRLLKHAFTEKPL